MKKDEKVALGVVVVVGIGALAFFLFRNKLGMGYGSYYDMPLPNLNTNTPPVRAVAIQGSGEYGGSGGTMVPMSDLEYL